MSTIKSLSTKAKKSRLGWIIALGGAVAAAIGAAVYFGDKVSTAKPSVPVAPGTPQPPAGSVPLWTQVAPVANPQLPGTYMASIPKGASFLFADSTNDTNLNSILTGLNAAVTAGTVTGPQAYQTGTVAPAFWPADPFGSAAYRLSGVASQAFSLVLGPLTSNAPATTPLVWVLTGWAPAPTV